jgi:hypothetical protein
MFVKTNIISEEVYSKMSNDGAAVPRPSVTIASPAALQRRYKFEGKNKNYKIFPDNNRKATARVAFL